MTVLLSAVMGFLDFLKKDKPAPVYTQQNVQVPPPPGSQSTAEPAVPVDLPPDPADFDWGTPQAPAKPDPRPNNPVPSATMLSSQIRIDPIPADLAKDTDFNQIPLPPADENAPDFLDSAADDFRPPEKVVEKVVEKVYVDRPVETPASPVASPPLPDFTDEDFAALEKPALPPLPALEPVVKVTSEEQIVPPPANAVEMPEDEIRLPTGEMLELGKIEPAKFISSESYFAIISDMKATRRSLRQNDDVIKEAVLRHEQLDQQYKRVALDINAVQEHFMKIDGALFE